MVKVKYYNGCSLVDFFSFSLQTEVQKRMAMAKNRKTSSGWWTCAPFRPEKSIEGAFSKTEITTT